jgi:NAD(P)-dependent dehydrogenase (short-subunit alcohol dehydrogenase family)
MWQEAPSPDRSPAGLSDFRWRDEHWLLAGEGESISTLARLMSKKGVRLTSLPSTAHGDPDTLRYAIDQTIAERGPIVGVVFAPPGIRDARTGALRFALHFIQALLAHPAPSCFCTVTLSPSSQEIAIEQEPLLAFLRSVAVEHSEMRSVAFDLDAEHLDSFCELALQDLHSFERWSEIAYRGGRRYRLRLLEQNDGPMAIQVPGKARAVPIRPDRTYVIAGGLGSLGLIAADWLVDQGARNLVLIGRSGTSQPEASTALAHLRQRGASVTVLDADIANYEALEQALGQALDSRPPVAGIIHSAGVLDDGIALRLTWSQFSRVLAPKVQGAWNLHELSRTWPLDFFLLYSSAASLIGSPGQSHYAAANAYLDTLAHHRRRLGLPALAINWGPWAVGMAARGADRGVSTGHTYFEPLTVAEGKSILSAVAGYQGAQIAAFHLRRDALPATSRLARLLAEPGPRVQTPESRVSGESLINRLREAEPERRLAILAREVEGTARRVMRLEERVTMDHGRPLRDFGLESLLALDLRNELAGSLGIPLPASLVFDHPSVARLSKGLLEYAGLSSNPVDSVKPPSIINEACLADLPADLIARRLEDRVNAILGSDL